MGRGGVTKDREDGPDRKCIVTGEVQPKFGLIRFVVGPGDVIYPDISGKLPGRGVYVAADRDTLETAVSKKLFSHIPDDFIKISESGISKINSIKELKEVGYNGFLIGEIFMKNRNPSAEASNFINSLKKTS